MEPNKCTILVIDDDCLFAGSLAGLLDKAGYKTLHFRVAGEALACLERHRPDLIISDMRMSGVSGVDFCVMLRRGVAAGIPLVMLSALNDEVQKVRAFEAGADDYIVKPFSEKELLARLAALLRRCELRLPGCRVLVSGGVRLNLDTAEASLDGAPLQLSPKEYGLLSQLLKSGGRILAYTYLAEVVWGFDSVTTRNTIKSAMSRLRLKLRRHGRCIQVLLGLGYKWIPPTSGAKKARGGRLAGIRRCDRTVT